MIADHGRRRDGYTVRRLVLWAVVLTCWSTFLHFGVTSFEVYAAPAMFVSFPAWVDIAWLIAMFGAGNAGLVVSIIAVCTVVQTVTMQRRGFVLVLLVACGLENLMAAATPVMVLLLATFGV